MTEIPRRTPFTGKRLLVVDDQIIIRQIVSAIGERLGFATVDTAQDGDEALLMMRKRPYDVVISDWNMQPVTDFELLRIVRADKDLASTKFLIMTARMDKDAVLAAKSAGADGYMLKPFTPQALRDKILATVA
ncbi:response regulator [Methylobacterium oryzisoli]|uniref:response regulator n=1 Tax=Methylobacterium oryzisoli TaxID=3385502 RepID=UPI0038917248